MIPGSSGAKARDTEPSSLVVVDASFVLKLVLPEEHSDRVRRAWGKWVEQGVEVFAPYLLVYEVTSVLRHKVFRGELAPEEGEAALLAIQAQGIRLLHPEGLEQVTWRLAQEIERPTAYDTSYLALAELLGCELWTADMRLKNAAQGRLPYLRWIEELPSPGPKEGRGGTRGQRSAVRGRRLAEG